MRGCIALLGCHGGERRYLLAHALAAAVRTDNATLFEIRHVKNLGKFFAAVLTEKYVLGHDRFLLDQFLSAHILTRSIVRGNPDCSAASRVLGDDLLLPGGPGHGPTARRPSLAVVDASRETDHTLVEGAVMHLPRVFFPALSVLLGAALPAAAQSVVSTHAGVIHYFEGAVSIGGAGLQPQFGRFPEIPEGAELRTAEGRAEVLLGPGVILRVAEDSAVKILSSSLADTRLEVLSGTAILESKDALPGNSLAIMYREWQMRIPKQGVYRIDSNPEQLRVYNGEVEVRAAQGEPVTVKAGQTLPLAAILVPDQTLGAPGDGFNSWAFERSEAIAVDNATAAQIVDDPALYPNLADASGLALAGYTYFPPTTGYPYMGYGTYGAWSPYVGGYYGYGYAFGYGPGARYTFRPPYPGFSGGVTLPPLHPRLPPLGGYHPGVGFPISHPVILPPSMPRPAPAARPAIHGGHR
jgi:hypothetical protein